MGHFDASPDPAPGLTPASAWAWLALPPESLLKDCRQARFQGSGPGGQKRNRVYSGVRLTHAPSGLTAECVDSRASARNLAEALSRLRLAIALAAAPGNPEVTQAADGAEDAAAEGSAGVTGGAAIPDDPAPAIPFRAGANPAHPDYARGALRALCLLRSHAGQLAPAAAALGCTPSALTRYLKGEKSVWARAREIRMAHGLHPLK